MKQILLAKADAILSNPHTSLAALAGFACGVVAIIWPQCSQKCAEITTLATSYGLMMAGDAAPKPPVAK